MNTRQILERRAALTKELAAIHAAHPDGALSGEAESRWAALRSDLESTDAALSRQALLDEIERRSNGTPLAGADHRFDQLAGQVNALDVIRAQMGATDAGAGRAREVSAEIARRSGRSPEGLFLHMGASAEQRTFSTTTPVGGPGSNTIQTTVSPNLIDRLRERVLVRQMGATVLTGLVGNLSVPRLKASASAQWIAEGGSITATDPQTDAVAFSPKHVGGIVGLSRNMVQQPSLDVARMVEDDLAKLIAVAIDQAAILGGGSNQPAGIMAAGSGVGTIYGGANGLAPTWANVVALIGSVDASNALGGSLGFLTNAKVVKAMRTTAKTTTDTASNFIMNDAATLAGYVLGSTQNAPANLTRGSGTNLSPLIFGDWSQLVLGFWSELDILVSPYDTTAFASGGVLVRAMATADVKIKQPLAFSVLPDIIAP